MKKIGKKGIVLVFSCLFLISIFMPLSAFAESEIPAANFVPASVENEDAQTPPVVDESDQNPDNAQEEPLDSETDNDPPKTDDTDLESTEMQEESDAFPETFETVALSVIVNTLADLKAEILNALTDGTEYIIELGADISFSSGTDTIAITNNRYITIDLKGHTIDGSTYSVIDITTVSNTSKIKIIDTSTGGRVTSSVSGNSGTIVNRSNSGGTIEIAGGTITNSSTVSTVSYAINAPNGAAITVSGGVVQTTNTSNTTHRVLTTTNGVITIIGGTIRSDGGGRTISTDTGNVNISGCNIYSALGTFIFTTSGNINASGAVFTSGATNVGEGIHSGTGGLVFSNSTLSNGSGSGISSSGGNVMVTDSTITSGGDGINITGGSVVTITDTTVSVSGATASAFRLQGTAVTPVNAVLENVTFTSSGNGITACTVQITNYANVTIKSGTFTCTSASRCIFKTGNGVLIIEDGNFSSVNGITIFNQGSGTTQIQGGIFTSDTQSVVQDNSTASGNFNISGGSFTNNGLGLSSATVYSGTYFGELNISGGTFTNTGNYLDHFAVSMQTNYTSNINFSGNPTVNGVVYLSKGAGATPIPSMITTIGIMTNAAPIKILVQETVLIGGEIESLVWRNIILSDSAQNAITNANKFESVNLTGTPPVPYIVVVDNLNPLILSLNAFYTITSSAGANGAISPLGATTVDYGNDQTYTITPNTGYHVDDVLVDGASVGPVTSYTFANVTADHTIAATFAIDTFTITSSAGANGAISPLGATLVTHGTNFTYAITPNTHYQLDQLLIDGIPTTNFTVSGGMSTAASVISYTFTNVSAPHTIHATFKQVMYTITATVSSAILITPAAGVTNVGSGDSQMYTFTLDPSVLGVQIDKVYIDGVVNAQAKTNGWYLFANVSKNHTIRVTTKAIGPATGDEFPLWLIIVLVVVASGAIAILIGVSKRKNGRR